MGSGCSCCPLGEQRAARVADRYVGVASVVEAQAVVAVDLFLGVDVAARSGRHGGRSGKAPVG